VLPPRGEGDKAVTDPARPATRSYFLRRIYAGRDLELFLVTAIATILIVRAALAAAGWPQLGGGKIHFAHLLWGGLGMLIALVLFMALHGRLWRQLAALSAGIGFGLFIDELGKFITSDNDYFFEPVVALIYVVFVVLFLVARAIDTKVAMSPQVALVNAYDVAKEAVIRDLDESERSAGLSLLATCDQGDPAVRHLAQVFADTDSPSRRSSEPYQRLKARLRTPTTRFSTAAGSGLWSSPTSSSSLLLASPASQPPPLVRRANYTSRSGDSSSRVSSVVLSSSSDSPVGTARDWPPTAGSSVACWSSSSSTSPWPSTSTN
jgi:hypothetical protein